jgi:hypothetical protein
MVHKLFVRSLAKTEKSDFYLSFLVQAYRSTLDQGATRLLQHHEGSPQSLECSIESGWVAHR